VTYTTTWHVFNAHAAALPVASHVKRFALALASSDTTANVVTVNTSSWTSATSSTRSSTNPTRRPLFLWRRPTLRPVIRDGYRPMA
jgi:hypothetical protein